MDMCSVWWCVLFSVSSKFLFILVSEFMVKDVPEIPDVLLGHSSRCFTVVTNLILTVALKVVSVMPILQIRTRGPKELNRTTLGH